MLTLGEAQDIFIDALPDGAGWSVQRYPGAPDDMDYVEKWTLNGALDCDVTWFDSMGFPVSVVAEALHGVLHRDIIDPEDIESVATWLTQN